MPEKLFVAAGIFGHWQHTKIFREAVYFRIKRRIVAGLCGQTLKVNANTNRC